MPLAHGNKAAVYFVYWISQTVEVDAENLFKQLSHPVIWGLRIRFRHQLNLGRLRAMHVQICLGFDLFESMIKEKGHGTYEPWIGCLWKMCNMHGCKKLHMELE